MLTLVSGRTRREKVVAADARVIAIVERSDVKKIASTAGWSFGVVELMMGYPKLDLQVSLFGRHLHA